MSEPTEYSKEVDKETKVIATQVPPQQQAMTNSMMSACNVMDYYDKNIRES